MNEVLSLRTQRTRVMWSAEERTEWLRLFEQSGQTAADFCRDNDLPQATLSCWVRAAQEPPAEEPRLVEVPREILSAVPAVREPVVSEAQPIAATAVALQLPSGLRIEIPVGLDMGWFNGLLQSIVNAKV